jgi:hypothetical protein
MKKWILTLALTTVFTHAFPHEAATRQEHKTYIAPDQILVMQHGIFCLDAQGFAQPIKFLSHDENGLFMVDDYIQCPACGIWSEDGTLHRNNCPYAN